MKTILPDFRIIHPQTVEEALAALNGSAQLLAGGTDLITNMRRGIGTPETLVDLTTIEALHEFTWSEDGLQIGACVTLREIAECADLDPGYRALREAARAVAGPSHRNAATLGGNLCLDTRCVYYNQSHWWRRSNDFCLKYKGEICHVAPQGNRCRAAFSGDVAPALMVLGAEVDIAGRNGTRRVALSDLYQEDGANHLTLEEGEILTGVHVPASKARSAYEKIRVRGSIDFPLAGVAVACEVSADDSTVFRLAITGTNSRPFSIESIEPLEMGGDLDTYCTAISKQVQRAVSPQRTTTIAAHYRRVAVSAMAARLVRRLSDC